MTIGDDVNKCRRFLKYDEATGRWGYSAGDVIDYLLSEWETSKAEMDETNAVSNGLAEYMMNDFEAHEGEWSKLPSDRTSIDVVPDNLASYMLSDWEDHQPKKETFMSKTNTMSEQSLPKGLAEYLLADFEAHEKDWELNDKTSVDQVPTGLADYMVRKWEAKHEAEKKSVPNKADELSKTAAVPKDLEQYLLDEYEAHHDSYASIATMTVHGQRDVSP